MTSQTKSIVLNALNIQKGDDLLRMKHYCRGFSHAEMQLQHGESGRTRQEWLDFYQKQDDAVRAAIQEVEAIQ